MTPRKTRARNQHAGSTSLSQPPLVSDYDSEVIYTAPPTMRTASEINFSVIRRHLPSLTSILAISPSTHLYKYDPATGEWDRTGVEGTMFVCALEINPMTGIQRHCIILLNRKGLENCIIGNEEIDVVEITPEYLILKMKDGGEEDEARVLGFYMVTDEPSEREAICQMVKSHWELAMVEAEILDSTEGTLVNYGEESVGAGNRAGEGTGMGRRLSLSQLFGHR